MMKIPKDKLPLRIESDGEHVDIYAKDNDLIGEFYSDGYSQYVVKAANEFPEALSLIKSLWEDANMALDGDWDRSDEGFKAQIELIEKFLNKLEDDNI